MLSRLSRAVVRPAAARAFSSSSSSSSSSQVSVQVPEVIGLTSGAPDEFVTRSCLIYRPARTASQQGEESKWKIEFDTVNKWVNPLMGWTSARDTAQQLREKLYFDSKEDAVKFAEREGFKFEIVEPHEKIVKGKSYSNNFRYKGPAPNNPAS